MSLKSKTWRTKRWNPMDIALLKWSSACFGAILGAYFSDFVIANLWVFIALVVIFAIKPAIAYYSSGE